MPRQSWQILPLSAAHHQLWQAAHPPQGTRLSGVQDGEAPLARHWPQGTAADTVGSVMAGHGRCARSTAALRTGSLSEVLMLLGVKNGERMENGWMAISGLCSYAGTEPHESHLAWDLYAARSIGCFIDCLHLIINNQ